MEIKIKCIGDTASDLDEEYDKLWELFESYKRLEKFLVKNAETIAPQDVKPFGPWFEDGIISAPSASSVYYLQGCLLENFWRPAITVFDSRKAHEIKMAGENKKVDNVEARIRRIFYFELKYPYQKERVYQTSQDVDIRAFSSISELEKSLSASKDV